jgi:hypothetical protein
MVAAIGTGDGFAKGVTLPHGLDWSPDKYRPGIAPSSAKYRSAVIATCACCSCRPHGSCW